MCPFYDAIKGSVYFFYYCICFVALYTAGMSSLNLDFAVGLNDCVNGVGEGGELLSLT